MWCGCGVLTTQPVFADFFEVQTISDAVTWVSQFIPFGVVVLTEEEIQQDLDTKRWSRIGASSVFEYFLTLDDPTPPPPPPEEEV